MKIRLDTGTTYDITSLSDVKKLKNNMSKMYAQKQSQRLLHILDQVLPYKDYSGNNVAFMHACSICKLLAKYSLILTVRSSQPEKDEKVSEAPAAQPLPSPKQNERGISAKLDTPTLTMQRPITMTASAELILTRKQEAKQRPYGQPKKAPIQVSFRDDQGKRMHAAFYDHYSMRKITKHPTVIELAPSQSIAKFNHFIKDTTHELAIETADYGKKIAPSISTGNPNESGLLFIPGRPREDKDFERREHEKQLIKNAYYRGQPILAVCAGSWQLWEAFGGNTKTVTDHCYANMPYIVTDGSIGNNVPVHRVQLTANTFVAGALNLHRVGGLDINPKVNSVHWEAPDEKTTPFLLEVSATALPDSKFAPNSRQSAQMEPTQSSIEAFEMKYGAPVVGIQWHLEAYYKVDKQKITAEDKRQLHLLNEMAKAGDAYHAKRQMLRELQEKCSQAALLNKTGIFRQTDRKAISADTKIESHETYYHR